jgi:hypothetical protein
MGEAYDRPTHSKRGWMRFATEFIVMCCITAARQVENATRMYTGGRDLPTDQITPK